MLWVGLLIARVTCLVYSIYILFNHLLQFPAYTHKHKHTQKHTQNSLLFLKDRDGLTHS